MMLYIGGYFLQLLEGRPAMVDVVCGTIFRDKREMCIILREPIAEIAAGFSVQSVAPADSAYE